MSTNLFNKFNTNQFKKSPPPENDSEKTKKELDYIGNIKLDKRFFQKKDDILGNFCEFLDSKKLKYDKKFLTKVVEDATDVIVELKEFYKRPRPFKLNKEFNDPSIKSTKGYAYPSGHSTQSNLLRLILTKQFPKYKEDFDKITEDIVYSRQMAKAHYPSDIKFGKKLAQSMYDYLKDNNHIKSSLKEQIRRVLREEVDSATKRRFIQVKRVLNGVLRSSYPCDDDNFESYFLGMIDELNQYYRFMYKGSDLEFGQPEIIVRKYLKNMIKDYYLENTKDC